MARPARRPDDVILDRLVDLERRVAETERAARAPNVASSSGAGTNAATIATSQTTGSTVYTDLATVGPQVDVELAANGRMVVGISAGIATDSDFCTAFASFEVVMLEAFDGDPLASTDPATGVVTPRPPGAIDLPASDSRAVYEHGEGLRFSSRFVTVSGLVAARYRVTAKYRIDIAGGGTTGTFRHRDLLVIPL